MQTQAQTCRPAPVSIGPALYAPAIALTVHVLLVIGVLGWIFLSESEPTPDANIGTGIGLLGMSGLALPWSAPAVWGTPERISDLGAAALLTALALGNVVIHAGLWLLWIQRRHRAFRAQLAGRPPWPRNWNTFYSSAHDGRHADRNAQRSPHGGRAQAAPAAAGDAPGGDDPHRR